MRKFQLLLFGLRRSYIFYYIIYDCTFNEISIFIFNYEENPTTNQALNIFKTCIISANSEDLNYVF